MTHQQIIKNIVTNLKDKNLCTFWKNVLFCNRKKENVTKEQYRLWVVAAIISSLNKNKGR